MGGACCFPFLSRDFQLAFTHITHYIMHLTHTHTMYSTHIHTHTHTHNIHLCIHTFIGHGPHKPYTHTCTHTLQKKIPDLFYGGENHPPEQPQALTCPLCGGLGFSEQQLKEHVAKQHKEDRINEVVSVHCEIVFIHVHVVNAGVTQAIPMLV